MKDSGKERVFESGAKRDTVDDKPRYNLIPYECLDRVGLWYGLGAKKRGDNNWRKGMPTSACFDSMMRHASKFAQGMQDEDHLAAIIWNAIAIMFNEIHYNNDTSIHDMPNWYTEDGKPNKEFLK
jgi:hypothetical protein